MLSSFRARNDVALPAAAQPATDWKRAAAWLLGAGLAQATLVHFVAIRGAVPSLIFVVVATYAVRSGTIGAILFGAAAGLLEDALAGNTGAGWTIATSVVALGMSLSSRVLFTDSVSIFTGIALAGFFAREALYWGTLSLEGYPTGLGVHFAKIAILSAAYTTAVVLIAAWARWRFQPSR